MDAAPSAGQPLSDIDSSKNHEAAAPSDDTSNLSDSSRSLLYAGAGALVLLPVLYRIGVGSSIVLVLLAIFLSAVPEARQIVDSFVGRTPSGRNRLNDIHDAIQSRTPPSEATADQVHRLSGEDDNLVELDVGELLQPPISKLVSLVQRDFVDYWYNTSIALSPDTKFPKETASLLNTIMNNLVARIRKQDPKEVSMYLFHSASTALIGEVRENRRQGTTINNESRDSQELIGKVRRTSEELLLTLAPRSATSSALILSLLTEIISLQIWSTIQSMNADWINTTIVSHFGEAVTIAKEVQQDAKAAEVAAALTGRPSSDPGNRTSEDFPTPSETPRCASRNDHTENQTQPNARWHEKMSISDSSSSGQQISSAKIKQRAEEKDEWADTTFAASGIPPFYGSQDPFSVSSIPAKSSTSGTASTPMSPNPSSSSTQPAGKPKQTIVTDSPRASTSRSAPSSPMVRNNASLPTSPTTSMHGHTRLGSEATRNSYPDPLEEALDKGAAKLKAFGKNLFAVTSQFLDTAIPSDDTYAIKNDTGGPNHGRRRSLHAVTTGTGATAAFGPSLKGKERERDADESVTSPASRSASPKPASIASRKTASSRPPSPGPSFSSLSESAAASSSAASIKSSTRTTSSHEPSISERPTITPSMRVQRLLDSFQAGGSSESHALLVKQLEHALFTKDLSLLFPEPQDTQLRAVLARHTASAELVDPQLVQLSDEFHAFLEKDTSGIGERLLRTWTQLDHFRYMVEMTKPTEAQLKEDAIALLRKVIGSAHDLDGIVTADSVDEKAYWTAVETVLLRLAQNPSPELFEPLQEWILREIQSKFWDDFLRANSHWASGSIAPVAVASTSGTAAYDNPMESSATRDETMSTSSRPASIAMDRTRSNGSKYRPISPSTSKKSLASNRSASTTLEDTFDLGDSLHMRHEEEPQSEIVNEVRSPAAPSSLLASASSNGLSEADTAHSDRKTMDGVQAPPAFSVTLTDLSPPSAYVNGHVKNRKDLEFLIAVEVEGSPGYILARKYIEFERMDAGIKKALPQSGTKAFPRAPLPSTNFQTSENLCHSLEHYLEALLHDDRYAVSDPVATFFAKERTDSKGDMQPLAFLGRGVNNIGKGVSEVTRGIGKGGEFATKGITTGFNQITGAVTSFPGLRRTTSGNVDIGSPEPNEKRLSSGPLSPPTVPGDERGLASPSATRLSLTSPSTVSLPSSIISSIKEEDPVPEGEVAAQQQPAVEAHFEENGSVSEVTIEHKDALPADIPPTLPSRPVSPEGYEVPVPVPLAESTGPAESERVRTSVPQENQAPDGLHYQPRTKHIEAHHEMQNDSDRSKAPPIVEEPPASPGLRYRMSFDELVKHDQELQRQQEESTPSRNPNLLNPGNIERPTSEPKLRQPSRAASPAIISALSPVEFNNILSFSMAILEEAYDLVDSTWNIRRGILKVLETLLRTSYASTIKAGVTRLVTTVAEEEFYVQNIENLIGSFWPPPNDVWWSTIPGSQQPERTTEAKEATRRDARRLILLQAPEGLKVTLGTAATADAFGRMHDALQGVGAERLAASLILDYLRLLLL